MKKLRWIVVALALVALIAGFAASTAVAAKKPPTGGGGCLCPDYFDPVICSDGNTYSNFCQAGCAGATGCTRTGDI